jgi:hypothetical protein
MVGVTRQKVIMLKRGFPSACPPTRRLYARYCRSGQIMSAVALLEEPCGPDDAAVKELMSGNICRCGAYPNIVAAIQHVRRNVHFLDFPDKEINAPGARGIGGRGAPRHGGSRAGAAGEDRAPVAALLLRVAIGGKSQTKGGWP